MDELASNHAEVGGGNARPDRRLDGSPERGCLAGKGKAEGKAMSKTENGRLSVGVDLHKTQFTVLCGEGSEHESVQGDHAEHQEDGRQRCRDSRVLPDEGNAAGSEPVQLDERGNPPDAENKINSCSEYGKDQESDPRDDAGIWHRNKGSPVSEQEKEAGADERSRGSRILSLHCLITQGDASDVRSAY